MTLSDPAPLDLPVDGQELAAYVAAKLCHDFISPAGAISSGLDLMNDPAAQDMRDDALGLIEQSARKLVALVHFARVAFGAATTSERFTAGELLGLVSGMTEGGRAVATIVDGHLYAIAVDSLEDVSTFQLGAAPAGLDTAGEWDFVTGIGEGQQETLLALDVDRLVARASALA